MPFDDPKVEEEYLAWFHKWASLAGWDNAGREDLRDAFQNGLVPLPYEDPATGRKWWQIPAPEDGGLFRVLSQIATDDDKDTEGGNHGK